MYAKLPIVDTQISLLDTAPASLTPCQDYLVNQARYD